MGCVFCVMPRSFAKVSQEGKIVTRSCVFCQAPNIARSTISKVALSALVLMSLTYSAEARGRVGPTARACKILDYLLTKSCSLASHLPLQLDNLHLAA